MCKDKKEASLNNPVQKLWTSLISLDKGLYPAWEWLPFLLLVVHTALKHDSSNQLATLEQMPSYRYRQHACQKSSLLLSAMDCCLCSAGLTASMPLPDVLVLSAPSMRSAAVLKVVDSELALSIASSSSVRTASCRHKFT